MLKVRSLYHLFKSVLSELSVVEHFPILSRQSTNDDLQTHQQLGIIRLFLKRQFRVFESDFFKRHSEQYRAPILGLAVNFTVI